MGIEVETRTIEEVNEVLDYASRAKTSLTRIILDNMVVPLPDGDVDVSMLKEAVEMINGRFETGVHCLLYLSQALEDSSLFFKISSVLLCVLHLLFFFLRMSKILYFKCSPWRIFCLHEAQMVFWPFVVYILPMQIYATYRD